MKKRVIAGMFVGALAVAGAFAMPAFGTPDAVRRAATSLPTNQIFFTPASADPKLAALIARNGIGATPFRFTPAESRGMRRPAVSALQIATPKTGVVTLRSFGNDPAAPTVGIAPIKYNLVSTTAAKRLTVSTTGESAKVDLGTSPGARRIDPGFNLSRPSKLKAVTDRPPADTRLTGDGPQMIDVGGAYSLRRNIDVTAGVRYKAQDRDRLAPMPDDRRVDSQAVYVGTTFRF
ncbi:MAG: hypothetical protein JSR79_08360 [Proteobacteria bacterium]|nr:hypothetical protein [Pseudomonadota bacterium]